MFQKAKKEEIRAGLDHAKHMEALEKELMTLEELEQEHESSRRK